MLFRSGHIYRGQLKDVGLSPAVWEIRLKTIGEGRSVHASIYNNVGVKGCVCVCVKTGCLRAKEAKPDKTPFLQFRCVCVVF